MNRLIKNKFIFVLVIMFMFTFIFNIKTVKAEWFDGNEWQSGMTGGIGKDNVIDTGNYKPTISENDGAAIASKAKPILNALRLIGVVVTVLAIAILGIQYMFASLNEKASYKEKMVPIAIGVFMMVGLGTILTVIQSIFS